MSGVRKVKNGFSDLKDPRLNDAIIRNASPIVDAGDPMDIADAVSTPALSDDVNMDDEDYDCRDVADLPDTHPCNPKRDPNIPDLTFAFRVRNIAALAQQKLSSARYLRGLPWKILVIPRPGQTDRRSRQSGSTIGIFLQANGDDDSPSWSCFAEAEIRVLDAIGKQRMNRSISHNFYYKENDWGFTSFLELGSAEAKDLILDDNSLHIEVYVTAEPPHGTNWNSKLLTGYVGMKNQGATCYMNSLLQALYFTTCLRDAVYQVPFELEDPSKSIPFQLQRVFYELQTNDDPVDTKKLTQAFGWVAGQTLVQHDVEEFLRIMMTKLESKMKDTPVHNFTTKLFEGKHMSYIRCKNVDFASSRIETFQDIHLNVKDLKDVTESFKFYVNPEEMIEDNQYDAGSDLGKQDAEKGIKFVLFPPVLHLHLKRFVYDMHMGDVCKVNDRFEFPQTLDLSEFLDVEIVEREVQAGRLDPESIDLNALKTQAAPKYSLHAVLVHSGEYHGGHYVCFINPNCDGKSWYKFDDDIVSKCTVKQAMEINYGGFSDMGGARSCTSAYMVVYIRDADRDKVLCDVSHNKVNKLFLHHLERARKIERRQERLEAEAADSITIKTITNDELSLKTAQPGMWDLDSLILPKEFRINRHTSWDEFHKRLADSLGWKLTGLRVWPLVFSNRSVKLEFLAGAPDQENIDGVQDMYPRAIKDFIPTAYPQMSHFNDSRNQPEELLIYLERSVSPQTSLPAFHYENVMLIFVKLYEPEYERLVFLGEVYVEYKEDGHNSIVAAVKNLMKLSEKDKIWLWADIRSASLPLLYGNDAILQRDGMVLGNKSFPDHDGDGVIVQMADTARNLENYKFPLVPDYVTDVVGRMKIEFVHKELGKVEYSATFSQKATMNDIAKQLAQNIGVDNALKIQFYRYVQHNYQVIQMKTQIRPPYTRLEDVMTPMNTMMNANGKRTRRLFFEVLPIPADEIVSKKEISILWQPNVREEGIEKTFYISRSGEKVKDVLELVRKEFKLAENTPLRMLEITSCRITNLIQDDISMDCQMMTNISGAKVFRVEPIPFDHMQLQQDDEKLEVLIPVAHFHREQYNCFGTPFIIKVTAGDYIGDVKERIRSTLGVAEKEFLKWKVLCINPSKKQVLDNNSAQVPRSELQNICRFGVLNRPSQWWLGLDHIDKSTKRHRSTVEKTLKIFN